MRPPRWAGVVAAVVTSPRILEAARFRRLPPDLAAASRTPPMARPFAPTWCATPQRACEGASSATRRRCGYGAPWIAWEACRSLRRRLLRSHPGRGGSRRRAGVVCLLVVSGRCGYARVWRLRALDVTNFRGLWTCYGLMKIASSTIYAHRTFPDRRCRGGYTAASPQVRTIFPAGWSERLAPRGSEGRRTCGRDLGCAVAPLRGDETGLPCAAGNCAGHGCCARG